MWRKYVFTHVQSESRVTNSLLKFQKYMGFREFLEESYCAFNVDYYGEVIKCDRAFCNSGEKTYFNLCIMIICFLIHYNLIETNHH